MNKALNYMLRLYKQVVSSIAFIPTLMIIASLLLGILFFYVEYIGYTGWISEHLDFAMVHGADNARMILTTIIGGIISLTVFSFSMVMVVLNRASASLSPRVLPQLVAQKFHQFVLGFYMGTIVYSLILVINVDPDKNIPRVGILLAMIFAIGALGLFIYFIHSISQSIQVENILRSIHRRTGKQVSKILDSQKDVGEEVPEKYKTGKKSAIDALQSGYYQTVNLIGLADYLKEHTLKVELCIFHGQFVTTGTRLLNIYGADADEKTKDILRNYVFYTNHIEDENMFYFGLRKISEIAVKALSPGINDPGTALKAIRILTMIFTDLIKLKPYHVYHDEEGETRVYKLLPPIETLLTDNITPIRHYSAGSLEILNALFEFYHALLYKAGKDEAKTLRDHLQALIITAKEDIENEQDREAINMQIKNTNKLKALARHEFALI